MRWPPWLDPPELELEDELDPSEDDVWVPPELEEEPPPVEELPPPVDELVPSVEAV